MNTHLLIDSIVQQTMVFIAQLATTFGMALRTYHRRVAETLQSQTDVGRTVREAVLEVVRQSPPVAAAEVQRRFAQDDPEVVSGVLNDLVNSRLAYRSGRGERAVYRAASEATSRRRTGKAGGRALAGLAWRLPQGSGDARELAREAPGAGRERVVVYVGQSVRAR